jgi:hypothetical protein
MNFRGQILRCSTLLLLLLLLKLALRFDSLISEEIIERCWRIYSPILYMWTNKFLDLNKVQAWEQGQAQTPKWFFPSKDTKTFQKHSIRIGSKRFKTNLDKTLRLAEVLHLEITEKPPCLPPWGSTSGSVHVSWPESQPQRIKE